MHFFPRRQYDAIWLKYGFAWSLGTVTTYMLMEKSQELARFDLRRWLCLLWRYFKRRLDTLDLAQINSEKNKLNIQLSPNMAQGPCLRLT